MPIFPIFLEGTIRSLNIELLSKQGFKRKNVNLFWICKGTKSIATVILRSNADQLVVWMREIRVIPKIYASVY